MHIFWKLYLRLTGWKAISRFPYETEKAIVIVAPHTSWTDFLLGVAFRSALRIKHAKYLGKQELFKGPFGFLFYWLGGTPVDRFSKHGVVDQVVEKFNAVDKLYIALSPEGTRKKVDKLRTGFYYIAKKAALPIIMVGLDYSKKELSIAPPFYTTENEEADFKKILEFYSHVRGRYPEKDMVHLLSSQNDKV